MSASKPFPRAATAAPFPSAIRPRQYAVPEGDVIREFSISSQEALQTAEPASTPRGLPAWGPRVRCDVVGYEFGPFRLDLNERSLERWGKPIRLAPKVFETLLAMIERGGLVAEKDELMEAVWADAFVEENNLTQNVFTLRKILGEREDGQGPYIETVPRRGYRFAADVSELPRQVGGSGGAPPLGCTESSSTSITRKRAEPITSLAVLPLANATLDVSLEYLSDGITESIIRALSRLPGLLVKARASVVAYKREGVDPLEAGRELGVQAVLHGGVTRLSEHLVINVELIDGTKGWHIWGARYDRICSDILDIQEEIAREVSGKLRLELTSNDERLLAKHSTDNAEAYRLYLKGRFYWNKRTEEGLNQGIVYFQKALKVDPSYALAFAGLADCYLMLCDHVQLAPAECYPRAKAAALKALALDDTLAEAHASLAMCHLLYYWDQMNAEKGFAKAVSLNPGYATARHWYAFYLAVSARFDEAVSEIKRAQEIDPLSSPINVNVARIYYFARRYEEAIKQCRVILATDPNFGVARQVLALAYEQKGQFQEAIAEHHKSIKLAGITPMRLGFLGHACAAYGLSGEAREKIKELREMAAHRYVTPFALAIIYAGLDEVDEAFAWLERAYDDRSDWMPYLRMMPGLDRIRSDARFKKMIERVGLNSAIDLAF